MHRLWLVVGVAALLASCKSCSITCLKDSDCGSKAFCSTDFFCEAQCSTERDCLSGCACSESGRCVAGDGGVCEAIGPQRDAGCSINSDCNSGAYCQDNQCVTECRLQRDCPQSCLCDAINGQCLLNDGRRCRSGVIDAGIDGGTNAGAMDGGTP